MNIDQLKARLFGASCASRPHAVGVELLLEYIGDIEVEELFRKLPEPDDNPICVVCLDADEDES